MEDDGKVVWFEPATAPSDDGVPGVITGPRGRAATPVGHRHAGDRAARRAAAPLLRLPDALPRAAPRGPAARAGERVLLPPRQDLSDHFGALDRQLSEGIGHQIDAALRSRVNTTDLRVAIAPDGAATVGRFLDLLDLADAFCREERLSLARSTEQRDFQRWFLGEFVRQQNGESPLAWHDARVNSRPRSVS